MFSLCVSALLLCTTYAVLSQCTKLRKTVYTVCVIIGRIHLPLNGTLMDNTSIKQAIDKNFFVLHPILMKLGELAVHMSPWVLQLHQV